MAVNQLWEDFGKGVIGKPSPNHSNQHPSVLPIIAIHFTFTEETKWPRTMIQLTDLSYSNFLLECSLLANEFLWQNFAVHIIYKWHSPFFLASPCDCLIMSALLWAVLVGFLQPREWYHATKSTAMPNWSYSCRNFYHSCIFLVLW